MSDEHLDSHTKYPKLCSDKLCCCGGHNHKNAKKNKNHHATKNKLMVRKSRKLKRNIKESNHA